MARRSRTPAVRDIPPAPEPLYVEAESEERVDTSLSTTMAERNLKEIRERALEARAGVASTIAELYAWRDEIDATIAFLKSIRS